VVLYYVCDYLYIVNIESTTDAYLWYGRTCYVRSATYVRENCVAMFCTPPTSFIFADNRFHVSIQEMSFTNGRNELALPYMNTLGQAKTSSVTFFRPGKLDCFYCPHPRGPKLGKILYEISNL